MDINEVENQTIEQLYKQIGISLHTGVGFLGFDENEYIKLGKEWFKENQEKIQNILCTEEKLELLNPNTNNKQLIYLVMDTLSSISMNIPVLTLSALIVKIGLQKFCSSIPKKDFS